MIDMAHHVFSIAQYAIDEDRCGARALAPETRKRRNAITMQCLFRAATRDRETNRSLCSPKNEAKKQMDYAFIAGIESWGSGGQMLDILTLHDGQILVVMEEAVVLYADRAAFDAGAHARTLSRDQS